MARYPVDDHYNRNPRVGSCWVRTRHNTGERTIKILKILKGTRGLRYLVEGTRTGRQWSVSHAGLIGMYEPKPRRSDN